MPANQVDIVLVHGAWADGSSWGKVIGTLEADGTNVVAAPLPLTSVADDVAAVHNVLERVEGPVVLAGHAYAGAVIGATRDPKVASLVYVAALAPEEGESAGDVFNRGVPDPKKPKLEPDSHGLVWLPESAFADAFAPNASPEEQALLAAVQRPISVNCIGARSQLITRRWSLRHKKWPTSSATPWLTWRRPRSEIRGDADHEPHHLSHD